MWPYLGFVAENVGKQGLREAPYVQYTAAWACPVYDPPCRFVQYNQFDIAPQCPFSAPHENLHALPGWENP